MLRFKRGWLHRPCARHGAATSISMQQSTANQYVNVQVCDVTSVGGPPPDRPSTKPRCAAGTPQPTRAHRPWRRAESARGQHRSSCCTWGRRKENDSATIMWSRRTPPSQNWRAFRVHLYLVSQQTSLSECADRTKPLTDVFCFTPPRKKEANNRSTPMSLGRESSEVLMCACKTAFMATSWRQIHDILLTSRRSVEESTDTRPATRCGRRRQSARQLPAARRNKTQ